MRYDNLKNQAAEASELLKTLGNEWRLMILCSLQEGEMSVGALESALGLRQSALSQHLARLRLDGLVRTRRHAQTIYYSIAKPDVMRLIDVLHEIYSSDREEADGIQDGNEPG